MNRLRWIFLCLIFVFGCRLVETAVPEPTVIPPEETAVSISSSTPDDLDPPTEAPPEPIASIEATVPVENTVSAETIRQQLDIFRDVWQLFDTNYIYTDYNGLDWDVVRTEQEVIIKEGLSDEQFWQTMIVLIDSLEDDHSAFYTPEEAREADALTSGNPNYVGIGIYVTAPIPNDPRELILHVFPNGPADQAGIRPHDWLLAADGQPLCCDDAGNRQDIVRGPEGTDVILTIQSPGEEPRDVTVTRAAITQGFVVDRRMVTEDIGYIMVPTLWEESMAEQTEEAWRELSAERPLRGLVLDLRINGGGFGSELDGILTLFADGQLGQFRSRTETRRLNIHGEDIHQSQTVPIVVLVSDLTESYAELLSGTLQEAGRATLIGTSTAGNVETVYVYDLRDGSRVWIAEETFVPPSGVAWERVGVTPDVVVEQGWGDFATDADDVALQMAIEQLQSRGNDDG